MKTNKILILAGSLIVLIALIVSISTNLMTVESKERVFENPLRQTSKVPKSSHVSPISSTLNSESYRQVIELSRRNRSKAIDSASSLIERIISNTAERSVPKNGDQHTGQSDPTTNQSQLLFPEPLESQGLSLLGFLVDCEKSKSLKARLRLEALASKYPPLATHIAALRQR